MRALLEDSAASHEGAQRSYAAVLVAVYEASGVKLAKVRKSRVQEATGLTAGKLDHAIRDEGGLIEMTAKGGLSYGGKKQPTTWALTWRPIDCDEHRKREVVRPPPRTWENYVLDTQNESAPDTRGESAKPRSRHSG